MVGDAIVDAWFETETTSPGGGAFPIGADETGGFAFNGIAGFGFKGTDACSGEAEKSSAVGGFGQLTGCSFSVKCSCSPMILVHVRRPYFSFATITKFLAT